MRLANASDDSNAPAEVPENSEIQILKAMTTTLSRAVEALERAQATEIEPGTDFYEEVARFEINLIQRALRQTGGNQAQAARLLGLNQTTLHGKIKHYRIYPDVLVYNARTPGHERHDSRAAGGDAEGHLVS